LEHWEKDLNSMSKTLLGYWNNMLGLMVAFPPHSSFLPGMEGGGVSVCAFSMFLWILLNSEILYLVRDFYYFPVTMILGSTTGLERRVNLASR